MKIKAIAIGAGLIMLALGGVSAFQVLRGSDAPGSPAEPPAAAIESAPANVNADPARDEAAGEPAAATPTPFGMMMVTVSPRRAWTPEAREGAADDGGAADEGYSVEGGLNVPALEATPTPKPTMTPVERAERIERLRAALPTPLPPYESPTSTPGPVYFPTETPRDYSEARFVGSFDWLRYESAGYSFMRVHEGEIAPAMLEDGGMFVFECADREGLTLDVDKNEFYDPYSHFIWAWGIDESGAGMCWGVPADVDWRGAPPEISILSAEEIEDLAAAHMDEPLAFYGDPGGFSTPPPLYAGFGQGFRMEDPDGWSETCNVAIEPAALPWALWDARRGFRALSDEDMRLLSDGYFDEEEYLMIAEARERGYYAIVSADAPDPGDGAYCWRVENAADVPVERCYECQIRAMEDAG